ncbi:MAG: flagellar motor switch protein FliG [Chakrabartia godavariana]
MADREEGAAATVDGKSAAAVLMMLLAEDEAAAIVSHLDANEVKALGSAMLGVAGVSEDHVDAALELFADKCRGVNPLAADPTPRVRSVIEQALGPARAGTLLADIAPVSSPRLADMLDWMEVDILVSILDNEHPQVGALIVSSLTADIAAQALGRLEEARQTDLLLRAARLGKVSMEALTELEDIVSRYVGDSAPPPKVELGGSTGVAKIMNSLGKPKGERIIKAIRKADKPIADAIEEGMFVFEDLLDLDAKALGTVMRSVDSGSLVFALKGASKELVDRIFASMSQRAAQSIQDEMAEKTMVKRAEVDEAQKAVIAIARQLADAGEIVLGSSGNDYV